METKFQLSQCQQQFVTFESLSERARHLAFLLTGELKPALASGKETNSQFGIKLVVTFSYYHFIYAFSHNGHFLVSLWMVTCLISVNGLTSSMLKDKSTESAAASWKEEFIMILCDIITEDEDECDSGLML